MHKFLSTLRNLLTVEADYFPYGEEYYRCGVGSMVEFFFTLKEERH